ncbi:MAG: M23 family metallopeptidase, partial [Deltaproteobacteria bacterium]|nr:M23 family metallopeptidase [Deltaproteobacteria bacterium]
TRPGNVDLGFKTKIAGEVVESHATVTVKSGTYPSEKLRVAPRMVVPSKKDQKLIAKDRILLGRAYATKTLTRFWDPPVVMPIQSVITSTFGSARVYNGKKESVHFGTDLRAPTGTQIVAPIAGQVAVARLLYYTGNTVILDHGFGMFTIYGHMSKLLVKEGEIVKKGQVMGLSGMTGRANGPHLHWGVNLHGTKIDPMVLVSALKKQG